MSFFKNIVKEIKTVKSMIDIPELKNEREKLNRKMEKLNATKEEHDLIIQNETRIRQVMRELEDLSSICFRGQEEGQEEKRTSTKQVIDNLQNKLEESERIVSSTAEELSRVEQDLKRVNEKLSAARAAVR